MGTTRDTAPVPLTDIQNRAIELLLLHQFNPQVQFKQICNTLDIATDTLEAWRKQPGFLAEYAKRREELRTNFDDLRLAQRRERVKELEKLYIQVGGNVDLKLKILGVIRSEVGDDAPHRVELKGAVAHGHLIQEAPTTGALTIPQRATSAEDWTPSRAIEPGDDDG